MWTLQSINNVTWSRITSKVRKIWHYVDPQKQVTLNIIFQCSYQSPSPKGGKVASGSTPRINLVFQNTWLGFRYKPCSNHTQDEGLLHVDPKSKVARRQPMSDQDIGAPLCFIFICIITYCPPETLKALCPRHYEFFKSMILGFISEAQIFSLVGPTRPKIGRRERRLFYYNITMPIFYISP